MAISVSIRQYVRQRARFLCEYCGVHESDAGNELTVDHFQPRIEGGTDDLDNLVYCCFSCNQFKHTYWSKSASDPQLWNPRREPFSLHFLELDDGTLQPMTPTGAFALRLLHLNRSALIDYRKKRQQEQTNLRWLSQLQALAQIYEQLIEQQAQLIMEQRALLEEQRELLRRLFEERFS